MPRIARAGSESKSEARDSVLVFLMDGRAHGLGPASAALQMHQQKAGLKVYESAAQESHIFRTTFSSHLLYYSKLKYLASPLNYGLGQNPS